MAILPTRSLTAIVQSFAANVQGRAANLIDFSVGSTLRAIAEATAAVSLWLQGIALQILALTRASTSTESDLDSFFADFGLVRLGATLASGQVTFARLTASPTVIVIPIGSQVRTQDNSQIFNVTADPTNGNYSGSAGGYVLASTVATINVPVTAAYGGTGGNVTVGTINQILSTIPGIDTVTNAMAFTNGTNSESDAAFRVRFVLFINSLSKATKGAIGYAIVSLQLGLLYTITETTNFGGSGSPGFSVVVDDGSGNPPASIVTAATIAVDAVRAAGVRYQVQGASTVGAAVILHITAKTGYDLPTVQAQVTAALATYINGLGLGNTLYWSKLYQVAYDASPGVGTVSSLTLNGTTTDLTATASQTIKSSSITLS